MSAGGRSWDDLAEVFKQSKDAREVTEFVRTHKLSKTTKGPSGSFTRSYHSYSILYRGNRVQTIILHVLPFPKGYGEEHWRPYAHKLPGKLAPSDGRAEVIMKLGQPVKNRKNTWLHDEYFNWVHFNPVEAGISELYISPRVIEAKP